MASNANDSAVAVAAVPVVEEVVIMPKAPLNVPVIITGVAGITSSIVGFALTRDALVGYNSSTASEDQKKLKRKMDAFALVHVLMAAIFAFVLFQFGRKRR